MPQMKAKKDFQHGRGIGAPFVRAGDTFETDPARAAELVANGLVEDPEDDSLPPPVRAVGAAMPAGSILPPVHPVNFGEETALRAHARNAERRAARGEKAPKVEPQIVPGDGITAAGQMEPVPAGTTAPLSATAGEGESAPIDQPAEPAPADATNPAKAGA